MVMIKHSTQQRWLLASGAATKSAMPLDDLLSRSNPSQTKAMPAAMTTCGEVEPSYILDLSVLGVTAPVPFFGMIIGQISSILKGNGGNVLLK